MKIYFLIMLLILAVISGCSSEIKQVCIKKNCFAVEIADSNYEREKGLMDRENLENNKGMLFVFDSEGIYGFWMKDTLISLDIIWINSEKKVVYIKENAQPCNPFKKSVDGKNSPKNESNCEIFTNRIKAKYVLEVNSGIVKELNIKMGDKFEF